ncbi:unnamed protein product [Mycena citricolor]|uniref:Acyl-CoA oxidase C-alpha1 domain-containing protein n=1 Tax=Mycena citricolor TaxID=2018698 RepID=A0AAD2GS16_9AGAR|nr:unnamed protein product [Mycena citricolor]
MFSAPMPADHSSPSFSALGTGLVPQLLESDLFRAPAHGMRPDERFRKAIAKAQLIASVYPISLDDIEDCAFSFWNLHCDPILCEDGAMTTLLTIQYNLVLGTILDRVGKRQDLVDSGLLDGLLKYRISGQFCLTEVDHGLDAANIETTATFLGNDRGYVLSTPHPGAAKYMPPTAPFGIPAVGVVMARLVRDEVDLGVKPFLVPIHDGTTLNPGIVIRMLPNRGGSSPVAHTITSFHDVALPPTALLQRDFPKGFDDAQERRIDFLLSVWRAAIGSLALSATSVQILSHSACIVAQYSQRRLVGGAPILRFSTQHAPILVALARSFVLREFYRAAVPVFRGDTLDFRVRHGMAACFKLVAVRFTQEGMTALSERCGAQGLFAFNRIWEMQSDARGIAIAEGDVLVLAIRLATELLLERYSLDDLWPTVDSPLSRHAQSLLATFRATLQSLDSHRSDSFNSKIIPHCTLIVEALGLQMAYDAAVRAGLAAEMVELFLVTSMRRDEGWYIENMHMRQSELVRREETAIARALPKLEQWVDASGATPYVTAPIQSQEEWDKFVAGLTAFRAPEEQHLELAKL